MTLSNSFIIMHINLRTLFSVLLFAIVVCVFAQTPVDTFCVVKVKKHIFRHRGNKNIAIGDTLFYSDTLIIPKNGELVVCKIRYHHFLPHYDYVIKHAGTFSLAEFLRDSHRKYYRHPSITQVGKGIIDDSLCLPPIDSLCLPPIIKDTLSTPIIKDTLSTPPNKPDTTKNLKDCKPLILEYGLSVLL